MINPRAIGAAFRQQAIHFLVDPQWVIPSLIAPFVFTIVTLMLYRNVDGPVVLYAVLGGGVLGMWGNTLFSSGWSINYDRMNGTLEPVMISPTPMVQLVAGRAIWNALIGLVNAALVFLCAELAFRTPIHLPDPVLFFITLVLLLLSLSALGLVLSAFFVMTRASTVLMQAVEFPIYVACGALIPLSVLPSWSNPISYALAPTWGVDALRLSAGLGATMDLGIGYLGDMAAMLLVTVAYLLLSLYLFRRLEHKVRVEGTLGRY
jgi:ABC-2 type transport system permease protein